MKERAQRTLDLPPPFRPVLLREVGDAFAHATAHAAALGAGTLVLVGRFDLAEFAVVLEPDEPLRTARRAFYAGMVALYATLAAAAPPEKPIAIEWPDAIHIDGGLIGGGRLAWPPELDDGATPPWLVFAASLRTVSTVGETGLYPLATALEEEGFGDTSAGALAASFARHFMTALDHLSEDGFAPLAKQYAAMLKGEDGHRCAIDESGDLIIEASGRGRARRELAAALASPSWLDPATGGPRR